MEKPLLTKSPVPIQTYIAFFPSSVNMKSMTYAGMEWRNRCHSGQEKAGLHKYIFGR